MGRCERCGKCCKANGLIPPLLPGEDAPLWLHALVDGLRDRLGKEAEYYSSCVFLTGDRRCAIYEDRPVVCRDFDCEVEGLRRTGNELR